MTVRIVIGILLGVLAGTVVDRVDRRQIMNNMNQPPSNLGQNKKPLTKSGCYGETPRWH